MTAARPILVGIDPGTDTGRAVWNRAERRLMLVDTIKAHELLLFLHDQREHIEVWFEDARLRTWFGERSLEKLQGAGSIKRDCTIIQDACEAWGIPYKALKPHKGGTKWTKEYFAKVSQWTGRCSVHARDAAVLVLGAR